MTQIDPDDDTIERHVLFWYRYDPVRRERRHRVVAAYDNEAEMSAQMTVLAAILAERKASGESEEVEHLSGYVKGPGYTAARNRQRVDERLGRPIDGLWLNFAPD
jgi:hypothetical protein